MKYQTVYTAARSHSLPMQTKMKLDRVACLSDSVTSVGGIGLGNAVLVLTQLGFSISELRALTS